MIKNGNKADIREVYQIVSRLEDKFDSHYENLDKRLSTMEGKVSVVSIVWSSIISIGGIIVGTFIRK